LPRSPSKVIDDSVAWHQKLAVLNSCTVCCWCSWHACQRFRQSERR